MNNYYIYLYNNFYLFIYITNSRNFLEILLTGSNKILLIINTFDKNIDKVISATFFCFEVGISKKKSSLWSSLFSEDNWDILQHIKVKVILHHHVKLNNKNCLWIWVPLPFWIIT